MQHPDPLIQGILERNQRVESEKAWETSWTRRLFIAAITYLTASLFLWLIETPQSFINALVPTGGYLLSTLSLPWIKRLWMRKRNA
jgi:hypothetical protein